MPSMNAANPPSLGMQLVEARVGLPIDVYLRDAYVVRELGQADIAAEIGVNPATVSRWLRAFGIQTRVIGHRKRSRGEPAA